MKTLPNLTGLRFVLAFLVVIYHVPQFCENRDFPFFKDWSIFHKGQEAVCMFFSLSGFLIINKLYSEKATENSINLRAFYLKRILRILPLYYLILTFGFFYYWIILPSFGFDYENNYDIAQGLFLSYTFFPNIFATYGPGGVIEILWSIGIEEQFYLLIAPLIFLLPYKSVFRFLILFTIFYFLLYFLGSDNFLRNYRMLFFYFSMSGVFSILFLKNKTKLLKLWPFIIILFLLYFTTSLFIENLNELGYHFFSMSLFGLTIFCLSAKKNKILDNDLMNYLGKISYGIYMYHAIMMQLTGFLFLKTDLHQKISSSYSVIIFNLLVTTTTIFIASISYKYFETYFLNLKGR